MTIVACSRCGLNAYDNNTQFSLAKVKVEDASCSYFVEPNEYAVRCGFVRDPHVGLLFRYRQSMPKHEASYCN